MKLFLVAATIVSALLVWLGVPGEGGFWFLLPVSLVPFLFVLKHARSYRQTAVYGFLFGVFQSLFLLYWIIIVLGRYGGLSIYLSVSGLFLLSLFLGCYPALFALLAKLLFDRFQAGLWLWLIPGAWVGIDWLKSVLFGGFPWMDIGYGLWKVPVALQLADLVGHYGISYCLVLVNCLVLFFLVKKQGERKVVVLPGIFFLLLVGGYNVTDFGMKKETVEEAARQTVGIVQGNIDQGQKWSAAGKMDTVAKYIRLSSCLTENETPAMIVWPETALPFYPGDRELFVPVLQFIDREKVPVLTGIPWYEVVDREKKEVKYYNSGLLLGPGNNILGRYYKSHLVPFGEYVPLQDMLFFVAPLVEKAGNFSPGKVGKPLQTGALSSGLLVCYESIFPQIAREWVLQGANLLVNITNDAWYGRSSAPHQSFSMVVLRAVETGRSVVRSANTGISGFIDPLGRVYGESMLFEDWAQKRVVSLHNHLTWYVRGGYLFAPTWLFVCLLVVIFPWRKKQYGNRGKQAV